MQQLLYCTVLRGAVPAEMALLGNMRWMGSTVAPFEKYATGSNVMFVESTGHQGRCRCRFARREYCSTVKGMLRTSSEFCTVHSTESFEHEANLEK